MVGEEDLGESREDFLEGSDFGDSGSDGYLTRLSEVSDSSASVM